MLLLSSIRWSALAALTMGFAAVAAAVEPRVPRATLLSRLEEIMGHLPGPERRCPLDVHVTEEADCGAFIRQLLTYQSEPGSRVPAYLLIPKRVFTDPPETTTRQFHGVLTLHPTHAVGHKTVVGLGQNPDDEYGVELARRGFVCIAPPYPRMASYQPEIEGLGYASGTMLAIWNNMRALDLLASLPYVRTNGFGSIGHSLGGHNGLFTAAFDDRIRIVVTSCGFDAFADYYDGRSQVWEPGRGWCQDRYMPRLSAYRGRLHELPFEFTDVFAAIAPRHVFVNAPLRDENFRWRSVDRVVSAVSALFGPDGGGGNIEVHHPDCPHRFQPEIREKAYQRLESALR